MAKKKQREGKWHNNIGRIIKHNSKYFLKFERRTDKDGEFVGDSPFPLTINEGDIMNVTYVKDRLQKLVEEEKMEQETADKIFKREKFQINLFVPDEDSEDSEDDSDEEEKPKKKKEEEESDEDEDFTDDEPDENDEDSEEESDEEDED